MDQIARLCQGNEYLKGRRRALAIECVAPVLGALNQQIFEATRNARHIQPKYKRLYLTGNEYWTVMEAQGFLNTSLKSVTTLGWNKYFFDDSERYTLLGALVRSAKQYGHTDHPPDQLSIRSLAFLASLAAGKVRMFNHFDLVVAVPSYRHSSNGLPLTIARMVAGHLGCQNPETASIAYTRRVHQMKEIRQYDHKLSEIKGAMEADRSCFQNRSVLIIDDMLESGATLREAARAIRTAGANQVHALTLARTRRFAKETMNLPCQ